MPVLQIYAWPRELPRSCYKCFVWAAIDIETKELVAFDASARRSSLDAYIFLSKVKAKCKEKLPIIS
jgi:transposase-like protein